VPLRHPRDRGGFSLHDIFEYPDLLSLQHGLNNQLQATDHLSSNSLLHLEDIREITFVLAGEKSGRSALSRMICEDYYDRGNFPILATGQSISHFKEPNFKQTFQSLVTDQYQVDDLSEFFSAPK